MRCSRPRRRYSFSKRMLRTSFNASSPRRRQSRRISLRDTPKPNPIEMSGANAMRARSTATQGSRNEFDLSYSNKCYILSRGCAHDKGCNICGGTLLVILRRSRFGASTSRFCLLARLRLLSTRKSSTTAYRVAICGGFAAFSEMTHRGMGVRICIPAFEESWGGRIFCRPFK